MKLGRTLETGCKLENAAMLFAPFGCTHPPSPVPPFLLTQKLSPKDIAGSEAESLMMLIGAMGPKGLRLTIHVAGKLGGLGKWKHKNVLNKHTPTQPRLTCGVLNYYWGKPE